MIIVVIVVFISILNGSTDVFVGINEKLVGEWAASVSHYDTFLLLPQKRFQPATVTKQVLNQQTNAPSLTFFPQTNNHSPSFLSTNKQPKSTSLLPLKQRTLPLLRDERVLQRLARRHPLHRVPLQQSPHKIHKIPILRLQHALQIARRRVQFPPLHRRQALRLELPSLGFQQHEGATGLLNGLQSRDAEEIRGDRAENGGGGGEQRSNVGIIEEQLAGDEFGGDAAERPEVDALVEGDFEEDFGRAIAARLDVRMHARFANAADKIGAAEVDQFHARATTKPPREPTTGRRRGGCFPASDRSERRCARG